MRSCRLFIVILAVFLAPGLGGAHAYLVESSPARQAVLGEPVAALSAAIRALHSRGPDALYRLLRRAVPIVAVIVLLFGVWAPAEPRVIDLPLHEGVLPKHLRVMRVQQGDDVTLRWTTNQAVTIHLHGYDIERRLNPGATITMSFRARASGRFPITVHGPGKEAETTLGYLEVHPR